MASKRMSVAVLSVLMLAPELAHAGGCLWPFHHHRRRLWDPCGVGCAPSCAAPMDAGCCAPMMTPQAVFGPPVDCCSPVQPIVENCLVPQQCLTYRDVPQTCYRQEPVCTMVPVQTCRQVTVDEGCYQQVWVPKLVTKSVPQTLYQQQMSYRNVPYQVMQRVPVMETRMVPQQRMQFMAPGCCGGTGIMPSGVPPLGPATLGPIVPSDDFNAAPGSGSTGSPSLPPTTLTNPAMYNPPAAMAPVPAGNDIPRTGAAEGEWNTIERRVSQFEKNFGYRPFGSKIQQASMTR